jgi:DNA-binding transcriptional MerR regulator
MQRRATRKDKGVIDDCTLSRIETDHPSGLTSAEILGVLAKHGVLLSEATLRKYIQLGLLPRSVRVGRKGKHQGSQGIYPVNVIRQILRIKQMMAQNYTIEQIQREFLFMRSDLLELEQTLASIFKKLELLLRERKREASAHAALREVSSARTLSKDLVASLEAIETRLTTQQRVERVLVS